MTDQFPRLDPMTGQPLPLLGEFDPAMTQFVERNPDIDRRFDPTTGLRRTNAVPPYTGGDSLVYGMPNIQPQSARITRTEVVEIRRREREQGVDFPLAKTSAEAGREIVAKVRDLPFTDRTMLTGIPTELRASLNRAMGFAQATDINDFDATLNALESLDNLGRALCIAGFIWPRLVLHEYELDGTDSCWLVDDLAASERDAYRDFAMRRRDGAQQEVERLATFPGAEMAETSTS